MLSPMVGYAATALGYIAASGGDPVQVREVARATGVPAPYLSKIVHQLSRKGLVATRRGVGGGVQLAFDPSVLSLYELCEALGDPVLDSQCLLGLGTCNDDVACPAHEFSRQIRARQLEFLRRTTLLQVGRYDAARRKRGTGRTAVREKPDPTDPPRRGKRTKRSSG
jgi:Rrf2 family protein